MASPLFGNLVLALWACLFFGAFAAYMAIAPDGDGFTRNANRVLIFLALQAAAIVPALLALPSARARSSAWMRWVSRMPAVIAGLLVGAFVLFVLYGMFAPRPGPLPATGRAPTLEAASWA